MDLLYLERLAGKDENVADLLEFYKKVNSSPFYDGYVSLVATVNAWLSEIQENSVSIKEDDKAFENYRKFLTDLDSYYKQIEYLRGKLSPVEIRRAEDDAKSVMEKAKERKEQEKQGID